MPSKPSDATPSTLGRRRARRRSGSERFHRGGQALDFDVRDFWQWSCSDLLSNATRGVVAEYLVAQALGVAGAEDVRDEWAAYDLTTAEGIKVEVKSAAYLQSWHQERVSKITFSVRPSQRWSADTGRLEVRMAKQRSVGLAALQKLATAVGFDGLANAVRDAARGRE